MNGYSASTGEYLAALAVPFAAAALVTVVGFRGRQTYAYRALLAAAPAVFLLTLFTHALRGGRSGAATAYGFVAVLVAAWTMRTERRLLAQRREASEPVEPGPEQLAEAVKDFRRRTRISLVVAGLPAAFCALSWGANLRSEVSASYLIGAAAGITAFLALGEAYDLAGLHSGQRSAYGATFAGASLLAALVLAAQSGYIFTTSSAPASRFPAPSDVVWFDCAAWSRGSPEDREVVVQGAWFSVLEERQPDDLDAAMSPKDEAALGVFFDDFCAPPTADDEQLLPAMHAALDEGRLILTGLR